MSGDKYDQLDALDQVNMRLKAENEFIKKELLEQARLLGISGSRELKLLSDISILRADRDQLQRLNQELDHLSEDTLVENTKLRTAAQEILNRFDGGCRSADCDHPKCDCFSPLESALARG